MKVQPIIAKSPAWRALRLFASWREITASVSRQDAKQRQDRKAESPPATRRRLVEPSMIKSSL